MSHTSSTLVRIYRSMRLVAALVPPAMRYRRMRHSLNGRISRNRVMGFIQGSVQGLTSVVIPPLHRIFFVKSYFLPDDVERPGLHFSINAPDILPHHTENEKLHAAHKKESDHEGCPPAHEPRPSDKPLEEYEHAAKDAGKRHEHADRSEEHTSEL